MTEIAVGRRGSSARLFRGGETDVAALAQNLARNTGYAVFPVRPDKLPALRRWPERASRDPDQIAALWRSHPAPLIGIVTGSRSGISVLDVDRKHADAVAWWKDMHPLLLPTRTFATRSGGLHLYFQHRGGVKNSQSKICTGVDTRGEGGYVISWWCVGYACRDTTSPQPWPDWLFDELVRKPAPPPRAALMARSADTDRAIDGIMRNLAEAREGERNALLFWSACRLFERGIPAGDVEALLIPVAIDIGLHQVEAQLTVGSAARGARHER
jgi:hypothetical protein